MHYHLTLSNLEEQTLSLHDDGVQIPIVDLRNFTIGGR